MDIFAMLQNAIIVGIDGEVIGQSVGFECVNGRMKIRAVEFLEDEDEEDDPDDGEKEDIPEDDASNKVMKLRAVAGEKQ